MLISVYFWNWNQKWFYFFLSFGNESKESLVEIIRRPSVKQLERTRLHSYKIQSNWLNSNKMSFYWNLILKIITNFLSIRAEHVLLHVWNKTEKISRASKKIQDNVKNSLTIKTLINVHIMSLLNKNINIVQSSDVKVPLYMRWHACTRR